MKVAIYCRVSKAEDQTVDNQLIQLRQWAKNSNTHIVGEWTEEVSSRDTRPKKEELLRKLRLKEIDGVAFVSLDRWGRTITELIQEFDEAVKRGWVFISLKEGLNFDTAAGRMFAQLLAVFANFERDRIKERTKAGVDRAKAQGKIRGRHPVDCGCGKITEEGNRHSGTVKPVRNESNMIIAWRYLNGEVRAVREKQQKI